MSFQNLNAAQKEAVLSTDGPLVVFAGAGSGKTRVITTRIGHLIDQGVPPWEILAVTFTNKAAAEMKHRLETAVPNAKRCLITTFHSACARWLREFAEELGFTSQFSIYDDGDSVAAMKKILKNLNENIDVPKVLPEMKAFLHDVKTRGLFPHELSSMDQAYQQALPTGAAAFYQAYQEYLAGCNAMDFGDLLMNTLLLLRRNERVRKILQGRFSYIMVDEYQDTNKTQIELLGLLAEKHGNLCVVGDDDQSIYSWRGAEPENISTFRDTFGAKTVALGQNYRCSGTIVRAAAAVITNNLTRASKELFTDNPDGEPIDFVFEADSDLEAWWIVDSIKQERHRFGYDDIALFYRTNSQSRLLEEHLRKENIPYTIFGAVEFYNRLEIKDIVAYLRVMVNEQDEVSLRRILNTPARGMGDKAVEQIEAYAKANSLSMMQGIYQMAQNNYPRLGPKLCYFYDMFMALKKTIFAGTLDKAIQEVLDATDYLDYLNKKFPDQARDKTENIYELAFAMSEYAKKNPEANLGNWLESITLVRDDSEKMSSTGISLMTLHMAKGLEFPRVYIAGVEEGLIPHRNNMEGTLLEEERRLFYVGMTRAKERLSLVCAQRRQMFNNYVAGIPSRFVSEIPKELIKPAFDTPMGGAHDIYQDFDAQDTGSTSYDFDNADPGVSITKGAAVFHPTFGKGTVDAIEIEFGKVKCLVNFSEFGQRKVNSSQLTAVSQRVKDVFF